MNAPAPIEEFAAITPAIERQIARELSPAIAWPTLILAIGTALCMAALLWGGLSHFLPLWACTLPLSVLSFMDYTLIHESIHDNLVPGYPRLRWINTAVGWFGSLGLAGDWPTKRRSHMAHHSFTNTDADPDIFVKGSFAELMVKYVVYAVATLLPLPLLRYLLPLQSARRELLSRSESAQSVAVSVAVFALLGVAIYTRHVWDWVLLLFIPTRIAMLFLAIFFSWLPHHPFDRTERYLNTRISLWPGAAFLTLNQNLHLMHHLWPSVPFYNYGRLYRRLRPLLVAKGSRIEGLWLGSRPKRDG